jgi:hypothetical protein
LSQALRFWQKLREASRHAGSYHPELFPPCVPRGKQAFGLARRNLFQSD